MNSVAEQCKFHIANCTKLYGWDITYLNHFCRIREKTSLSILHKTKCLIRFGTSNVNTGYFLITAAAVKWIKYRWNDVNTYISLSLFFNLCTTNKGFCNKAKLYILGECSNPSSNGSKSLKKAVTTPLLNNRKEGRAPRVFEDDHINRCNVSNKVRHA